MNREETRKVREYRETKMPACAGKTVEGFATQCGSYGESPCVWLHVFFKDKTRACVPMVEYCWAVEPRTSHEKRKLQERMERRAAKREEPPVAPPMAGLTAVIRTWVNEKGNLVARHDTIMTEDSPRLDAEIRKSGRKFAKAIKSRGAKAPREEEA